MRPGTFRTAAATLALAGTLAAALGALAVALGVYDVAADVPHTQPVYSLLRVAMERSVQRRARGIEERSLAAPQLAARGAVCFRDHCAACHGAPGQAPGPAGLAMQPLPGPLVDASARWRARELVWITRHGIRMTGMPAWAGRLDDGDIWAVVAFLQTLPDWSPAGYRQMQAALAGQACPMAPPQEGPAETTHLAERGRRALHQHACHGCHTIPGVVGEPRQVGPPLAGFGRRTLVAGRLPNTPQNLAAWIRAPQHLDPASAMPPLNVGAADAQAMAVYLGSLR
ncbi:MAG TPA: c-type cytochrome [Burkholderiaceae bacterium]|nr:c-type cytochrome [Burkholderiaceae bacterium]